MQCAGGRRLAGARIVQYLLEKSRICFQAQRSNAQHSAFVSPKKSRVACDGL